MSNTFFIFLVFLTKLSLNTTKKVRAVPFYMLWWGRVTRSNFVRGDRVVLVKILENTYGGRGGVQTDFKHDLTAKKRNPYGGRGWSSHFFKKIPMGGYRGVRGAVTRSPITYKMEQPLYNTDFECFHHLSDEKKGISLTKFCVHILAGPYFTTIFVETCAHCELMLLVALEPSLAPRVGPLGHLRQ